MSVHITGVHLMGVHLIDAAEEMDAAEAAAQRAEGENGLEELHSASWEWWVVMPSMQIVISKMLDTKTESGRSSTMGLWRV
jgi:hypothetical protein